MVCGIPYFNIDVFSTIFKGTGKVFLCFLDIPDTCQINRGSSHKTDNERAFFFFNMKFEP